MPRRLASLALAALAFTLTTHSSAVAQDEIEKPIVRKFPQGTFCALPISIQFTATTQPVLVTFTAVEFADDFGTPTWTEQTIDNVTVGTSTEVAAHFGPPASGSNAEFCYIGDPSPTEFYHFNQPGAAPTLLEQFDTDPGPRGWDMTQGGYFSSRTAPRNVEDETDLTGGSLGLGDGTGTPDLGATATTSVMLSGLTAGQAYELGAWWYAGFVQSSQDQTYLTVTVTTMGGTPIASRSWGALKASYR